MHPGKQNAKHAVRRTPDSDRDRFLPDIQQATLKHAASILHHVGGRPLMKAMVLAAGLGTRLRPITNLLAKPAIPVGPKSLIEWLLIHLASQNVTDAVVNLHYKPDSIKKLLQDGQQIGLNVTYSEEPEILGTAGGLANAASCFAGEETIIMVNADSLFDFNLQEAIESHRRAGALATMLLLPHQGHYSAVDMKDGIILSPSLPASAAKATPYHFTGIHILSTRIFNFLPSGFSDINRTIYPELIKKGHAIRGEVLHGSWLDFGDPSSYVKNTPVFLASKTLAADHSSIHDSTVIDSIIWDGARICGGAIVERCIVTTGVELCGGVHHDQVFLPDGAYPL